MTPGGVDSHVHLHQDNAPTGDRWLTGSRSALAGGNTTILAFATQRRTDESLFPVVEEYHKRAKDQSYIDYGFHLILTNPTEKILQDELRVMVEQEGISSVKLYMTYPAMKLGDGDMLEIMMQARELGVTTMIHAENSDMIDMYVPVLPMWPPCSDLSSRERDQSRPDADDLEQDYHSSSETISNSPQIPRLCASADRRV